MAEKLPVRLTPPFGGITRIRFKGSSVLSDLSATRLPRFWANAKVESRK